MQSIPSALLVAAVTCLIVGISVIFHYEVMQILQRLSMHPKRHLTKKRHHRPIILLTMFVLLLAHIIEIWLFAAAYWWLLEQNIHGALVGYPQVGFLDCVYFSVTSFTTVGWGDLSATGHIRFLAGTEALVGFLLITWSASVSYLVMAEAWGSNK